MPPSRAEKVAGWRLNSGRVAFVMTMPLDGSQERGRSLVGADAIGTHSLVNKVGTLVLAQAAQKAGTAFFVIAESFKWVPVADPPVVELAFEAVPNALVEEFLDDSLFRP